MGATPSSVHHEDEYDRPYRLLEEGGSWSPPPAATTTPSQSPSTSPPPPLPSSEPRRRTLAWAGAIRGFFNTLWLVILVFLFAPIAMQSTDKEDVFFCVAFFLLILAFPVMGYVVTWDQPGWL